MEHYFWIKEQLLGEKRSHRIEFIKYVYIYILTADVDHTLPISEPPVKIHVIMYNVYNTVS